MKAEPEGVANRKQALTTPLGASAVISKVTGELPLAAKSFLKMSVGET